MNVVVKIGLFIASGCIGCFVALGTAPTLPNSGLLGGGVATFSFILFASLFDIARAVEKRGENKK